MYSSYVIWIMIMILIISRSCMISYNYDNAVFTRISCMIYITYFKMVMVSWNLCSSVCYISRYACNATFPYCMVFNWFSQSYKSSLIRASTASFFSMTASLIDNCLGYFLSFNASCYPFKASCFLAASSWYLPVFQIDGSTSSNTQRLN